MKLGNLRTILSVAMTIVSVAAQPALANSDSTHYPRPQTARQNTNIELDKWYVLRNDLNVVAGEGIVRGTEISVVEFSEDGKNAQIAIDDDMTQSPLLMWVSVAQLERANPEIIDIEALEHLADLGLDIEVTNVARRRRGGGMTYCLRDVRIRAARYTRSVPQNIPMASIAYPRYKAAGWQPITYSPSVPDGTACFFGGGRPCGRGSYCGHAAIKIGPNRWLGAGTTPTPFLRNRTDSGRRPYSLHGCLTPPGRR